MLVQYLYGVTVFAEIVIFIPRSPINYSEKILAIIVIVLLGQAADLFGVNKAHSIGYLLNARHFQTLAFFHGGYTGFCSVLNFVPMKSTPLNRLNYKGFQKFYIFRSPLEGARIKVMIKQRQ